MAHSAYCESWSRSDRAHAYVQVVLIDGAVFPDSDGQMQNNARNSATLRALERSANLIALRDGLECAGRAGEQTHRCSLIPEA